MTPVVSVVCHHRTQPSSRTKSDILLAVFVQNVSNDDPVIFAASGFTAKKTGKSAPQPVAMPTFRFLDFGMNSGQIVASIKSVAGAKSCFHPLRRNERNDIRGQ